MSGIISEFLNHLKIDQGASRLTLEAYSRDLKQFEAFCDRTLLDRKESDFERFLQSLKKAELKASTIARKISALKQFYQYCIREEKISEDPTLFIESPRLNNRLPKALDQGAILKLLKACDEGVEYDSKLKAVLNLRDRTMVYLLYATGLRVTELVTLEHSKIDVEAGLLRVIGKRNKERIVPFAPIAGELLAEYMQNARPLLVPKSETLFLGQTGDRLTRQGFWKILKKLAVKAEIPSTLHPHMLRHTFATDLLHSGMNLRSLQMLLGHSDLQTTQVYTQVTPGRLKDVIEKYHPRGGKR